MSTARRRYEVAAAVPVLTAFGGLYAWVVLVGMPHQRFDAYLWLALPFAWPTTLWLTTSMLVVHHWWAATEPRSTPTDPRAATTAASPVDAPSRLLATVVAMRPAAGPDWGAAMVAELSQVRGPAARWRFALSCARALLVLPDPRGRAGRRAHRRARGPGPAVSARVLATPVASAAVIGAVAAAVVTAVAFVREHPGATEGLAPAVVAFSALVLAGCIALALVPAPRPDRRPTRRLGPGAGIAGALVLAGGVLASAQVNGGGPLLLWLLVGPVMAFAGPAWVAAAAHRSFLAGVRASAWTTAAAVPLTFAVSLVGASLRFARDGQWLFAGDVTTAGFAVHAALATAIALPVLGLPLAAIGATIGATGSTPRTRP